MTDMNNLQQDTDSIARNRIVTEINRNFFVHHARKSYGSYG